MIAWVATYLIWVMVAGYGAVWLFAKDRRGKLDLGLSAVIGLVIVLILIVIAGKLHNDPRPFVDDPKIIPLIPHAPDNGFPSDHSAAAGLIAAVVALRHRWYGTLLGIAAIVVAWARVAAHVHHLQDVAAGLVFGIVAAVLGALLARLVLRRTRLLSLPLAVRWLEPAAGAPMPGGTGAAHRGSEPNGAHWGSQPNGAHRGAHRDPGGPSARR